MLPGKKYTPDDILAILKKRFWWIAVPFSVIAAGTAVVTHYLPDVYSSTAVISVVPQQVPQQYVKSAVTTKLEDRLPAIEQKIMSRTKLQNIIEELNLYPEERRKGIMQDIVDQMRNKDIRVDTQKGDVFTVTYMGAQARTSQKVAQKLADLFIETSLSDRAVLTDSTSQFLQISLDEARTKLQAQEAKLAQYRMKYSGQLPTQVESNLQAMQNIQLQVQNIVEALNRDATQKTIVDRNLAQLQSDAAATRAASSVPAEAQPVQNGTTAQKLAFYKEKLAKLQADQLTDKHPDVKATKATIAELTKALETESLAMPVTVADETVVSPAERNRKQQIDNLTAEREMLDKQMAGLESQEKDLRSAAAGYQERLEQTPNRESELTELMRDYGTLTNSYNSLEARREEAALAAKIEHGLIGEQFQLLEEARVPEKPVSPNRPVLNVVGMVAGLGIGLLMVGFFEFRDSSFKTDTEVTRLIGVPVLAVVPVMQSDAEKTSAFRRRIAVWLVLGTGVAGCLAVVAYTFVKAR